MKREQAAEQRMVEATIECIEAEGIEGVTIRKIAAIAGMNSAAVNYYFRSKEALLERALAATTENAIGDWERIVEDSSLPPEARLRAILQELVEGVRKFPNLTRAHLHGPIMEGDFDTVFARRFRGFVARACETLAPALSAGGAPELRLAALFSAAMGWGFLGGLFAELPGAAPEDPEARKEYLEVLLSCLVSGGQGPGG